MADIVRHFIEPLSKVFRSDMDLAAVTDTLEIALRSATDYQLGRAAAYILETRKKTTFPLPGECIDVVRSMPAHPPAQGSVERARASAQREAPILSKARAYVAEYDHLDAAGREKLDKAFPGRIEQQRRVITIYSGG